jgi:thiosulfate reductase cytochrome b subunit
VRIGHPPGAPTRSGFRLARVWHFAAMVGLVTFVPGHLLMVALHGWRNAASMVTGTRRA